MQAIRGSFLRTWRIQKQLMSTNTKFNCQSCSKKVQIPQCQSCYKMLNYFKVFNMPQDYAINQQTLKDKAKDLQKQYHPDKYRAQQLQETMSNYSSYINQAKNILQDDLNRAVYLMGLKGVHISDDIEVKDSQFTMAIFELNMQIEQADLKLSVEIRGRIEAMLRAVQKQLQEMFRLENLQKCKEFVIKYKYLRRALDYAKTRATQLQQQNQKKSIRSATIQD